MATIQKFKLVFFTPVSKTRAILDHLFEKYPQALGKIGNYEQCAFVTRGTGQYRLSSVCPFAIHMMNIGQFKPTAEAQPTIGTPGALEFVEEDRVELIVLDQGDKVQLKNAVRELKKVRKTPLLYI